MLIENKKKIKLVKFMFTSLVLVFLTLVFFVINEVFAVFKFNKMEKNVDIPYGSSVKKISQILKQNNIINSPLLFRLYTKIKGSKNFQNGNFTLKTNSSYYDLVKNLKDINKVNDKINFHCGMNFFKFREKYIKKESVNINDIIKNINEEEIYSKFSFIKELDKTKLNNCYFPMEGLIFDNTVPIFESSTSESIAKNILENCNNYFKKLKEKTKSSKMDLWDILTLASIIQAETNNKDEMPRVSSVFHNRLKINKNLESDVTFLYYKRIIDEIKDNNINIDLNKFEKYDTYKAKGLPPGPICTPSLDAIDAAINPKKEDYYFFYANEKTGEISYSKDFETHKKNYIHE